MKAFATGDSVVKRARFNLSRPSIAAQQDRRLMAASMAFDPHDKCLCLWNAVWTASLTAFLAGVFLAFLPMRDAPAVLKEVIHPENCLACASTTPEARAVRDASLIRSGTFEAPTGLDGLSEGAGAISSAAITDPSGHEEQNQGHPESAMGHPAPRSVRRHRREYEQRRNEGSAEDLDP
jgi:hypothetical protein